MKLLLCALTLVSLTLPAFRAAALPLEPDFPCYLRTASGRVINLSAMCAGKPHTVAIEGDPPAPAIQLTNREAKFVADYKQLASVEANRAVAVALTKKIATDPKGEIGFADTVCDLLRQKASRFQIQQAEEAVVVPKESNVDQLSRPIAVARIGIINRLADRTYCAGSSL